MGVVWSIPPFRPTTRHHMVLVSGSQNTLIISSSRLYDPRTTRTALRNSIYITLFPYVPSSSRAVIQLLDKHPLSDRSVKVWFLFANLPTPSKVESKKMPSTTVRNCTPGHLTPTLHPISRWLLAMRISLVTPPASTKPCSISTHRGNRSARPGRSATIPLHHGHFCPQLARD